MIWNSACLKILFKPSRSVEILLIETPVLKMILLIIIIINKEKTTL